MAFLLDTNILLRWVDPGRPDHGITRLAVQALQRRGERMYVTAQNLVEFWNVSTRPAKRNGFGLTPLQADESLARVEVYFYLLKDSPAVYGAWRRLVVEHGVSGVQVHDARLAAFTRVYGVANILTFNTDDFRRFDFLTATSPLDVVSAG